MVKLSILYPSREGGRFDMDYYLNTHMPLSIRLLGTALKGLNVEQGLSGGLPDSPAPYVALCHMLFDSPQAFYEAFMPHAETLQGDIPNYTDIEPLIQISAVRIAR
ncbi:MAG: EthD family reductase [Burkholderiales bacterium]